MEEKDMAAGPSRETQISIAAPSSFPGFRFSPTDEELISYYLKKKMEGCEKSVKIISEIEICRYEPWDLPAKSIIQSQSEWFFFSARGKKYPHGSQSRRATELGYWKATGKERDVKSGNTVIGTKRTLVFHTGRAPKGERTEWIMHEYCMHRKSQNTPVICRLRRNTVFRHGDASNRESVSEGQVIATENSNNTTSVGETNHVGVPEGDKAAMGAQARRTSSSYDSHSIEPTDATSESNQKLCAEDAKAESSINRKESDPEDDFYADILKDDIIKLDESAMSVVPHALMESRLQTETEPQQSMQAFLAPAPVLGLANRRVRFNEPNLEEQLPGNSSILSAMESLWIENDKKQEQEEEYNYNAGKDKGTDWSSWWSPSCLITTSFAGKTIGRRVGAVVVVLFLVLLAVLLIISSRKSR